MDNEFTSDFVVKFYFFTIFANLVFINLRLLSLAY